MDNKPANPPTQENKHHNVIIIGSGPAGLTAAIYAARGETQPLILAGAEFGGQLMGTTEVENFPGFPEGIMGPQLMQNMLKQAEKYGALFAYEDATEITTTQRPFQVKTYNSSYTADSIILALGSSPRKLNIPGEQELWGRGVSTCATCDGAFYKDKVIAVVGGGDSAMEESTFLTKFAKKVYVIHRKGEFKASQAMQQKALNNNKIEVIWNTEVNEIVGETKVESLSLYNNQTESSSSLEVDGIFLAIGHIPNTQWLPEEIETDHMGYISVNDNTHTSVEGIFVAGDVRDHVYQQAITAAAMGCMAFLDAERYLSNLHS